MRPIRVFSCAQRGRSDGDWHTSEHHQRIEIGYDKFSNAISTVQKDYMTMIINETE